MFRGLHRGSNGVWLVQFLTNPPHLESQPCPYSRSVKSCWRFAPAVAYPFLSSANLDFTGA
jgi:hypothetical protein